MSTYEFNGDGDDDDYFLVAESGSVDHNGYGKFVDFIGRSFYCHYREADRYSNDLEAERAIREAEVRYGTACDLISITH